MKKRKPLAVWLLSTFIALCLGGCDIPLPGFADYDVSGYIQAYLDSSYHDSQEQLVAISGATAQSAAENHTTTVENAVVSFCNTYGLAFTEEQQAQLREIFSQLLKQAQYSVKDEEKADTGYTVEVQVTPITNFMDCSARFQLLLEQAQQEADAANAAQEDDTGDDSDDTDDWDDDGWGDDTWGDDSDETPIATPAPTPVPQVNPRELYLAKVLDFCRQQAAGVQPGNNSTITLAIRQTSEGELQLDLNQIEEIDNTLLPFTSN